MQTQHEPPPNAPLRILRRKQVEERVSLSCSTIYKLISEHKFPKPIQLSGAQAVGWIESEIEAFLRERIAASRGDVAKA
jgi:prophage regulatory protein